MNEWSKKKENFHERSIKKKKTKYPKYSINTILNNPKKNQIFFQIHQTTIRRIKIFSFFFKKTGKKHHFHHSKNNRKKENVRKKAAKQNKTNIKMNFWKVKKKNFSYFIFIFIWKTFHSWISWEKKIHEKSLFGKKPKMKIFN